MAAENNALLLVEQQILPALGQGNGHFARDHIGGFAGLVEDFSLQHRQNIEQRHLLQHAGGGKLHIVAGHILPGQHPVQGAVLVGNRHGGDILLLLQHLPGPILRHRGAEHRRGIVVQILHLGVHTGDQFGGLEAEPVQHNLGLIGNVPQTGGLIFPVAQ